MKKVTDPKQDHLNEVYRNIFDIAKTAENLASSCQGLSQEARKIAEMNKLKSGDALYLTHNFLIHLADVELYLELLHDYYQCDYDSEKRTIIEHSCEMLSIND